MTYAHSNKKKIQKYLFLFVIISNHSFGINLKILFIGVPMNQGYWLVLHKNVIFFLFWTSVKLKVFSKLSDSKFKMYRLQWER